MTQNWFLFFFFSSTFICDEFFFFFFFSPSFNNSYQQLYMTFPVLPVISSPEDRESINEFSLVGQVIFPIESVSIKKHFIHQFPHDVDIFVNAIDNASIDQIVELLNVGIKQVFVNETQYREAIEAGLPSARFVVSVDVPSAELVASEASFVVTKPFPEGNLKEYNANENRVLYIKSDFTQDEAIELAKNYIPVIPSSKLSVKREEKNKISISAVFVSTLTTDRPDGLYTTLITTPSPSYTALGIVYSSKDSIVAAIEESWGLSIT